eukprot:TRINITY_DN1114_c0_g1_i1.p1 TRINITY_DN1114_c0_g1~~TRINITY_DN1114_c0_g1_i1.p1  ORF type:complete len:136 (-),score=17.32 TRINITY_DN1114_c0_g1_i1:66-473(-)
MASEEIPQPLFSSNDDAATRIQFQWPYQGALDHAFNRQHDILAKLDKLRQDPVVLEVWDTILRAVRDTRRASRDITATSCGAFAKLDLEKLLYSATEEPDYKRLAHLKYVFEKVVMLKEQRSAEKKRMMMLRRMS